MAEDPLAASVAAPEYHGRLEVRVGHKPAVPFVGEAEIMVRPTFPVTARDGHFGFTGDRGFEYRVLEVIVAGNEYPLTDTGALVPGRENVLVLDLDDALELFVVAAESGAELEDVRVVKRTRARPPEGFAGMGDERYAELAPPREQGPYARGMSPLEFAPDELPIELWVTAPGRAWASVEADVFTRRYEVALGRASSIRVAVRDLRASSSTPCSPRSTQRRNASSRAFLRVSIS